MDFYCGQYMEAGERFISAALSNNFASVAESLKENPDLVNYRGDKGGLTALMAVSGSGMLEMSQFLISQSSIDLKIMDFSGRRAIEHARIFPEIVRIISKAMYPNWKEPKLKGPS